jgi:hypothetical protein
VKRDEVRIRERPWLVNMIILQGDRWYLNAPQLLVARTEKLIASLPDVNARSHICSSRGVYDKRCLLVA